MASNVELQRKLNQGVESAKAGDRSTARRLLEEVVAQDDRNELAWIWLATVASGASERREYLRKVLEINPRNQRAREALTRLGEEPPASSAASANRPGIGQGLTVQENIRRNDALAQRRQSGGTGMIFVIAAVAFLLAGLGIIIFGSGILNSSEPIMVTATLRPALIDAGPTPTPSDTPPPPPTNTSIPAELITRTGPTLPPTVTATATLAPTVTVVVTEPFELVDFEIYYTSLDPSVPEPSVLSIRADGSGEGLIENQMRDFTFAADGYNFAFVRDVVSEMGLRSSEIFVSTLNNPSVATQITSLGAIDTSSPSYSPDGSWLVFSSSNGRAAPELWIVSSGGGEVTALMGTPDGKREPSWSPAGGKIAYTSDQQIVGSTEIFILDVTENGEALGEPVQATDSGRNSYSPSWSADGRTIVFASDRSGDSDIYTMDSQGNNEQLVTISDGNAEDRHPSMSADGRWVTFVSNREDGSFQTYVIRTNGTALRRITTNERIDIEAVFRPRSLNSDN